MVSLPERRRSSSPLAAAALLLDRRRLLRRPSSGRSGGRPRRARRRPARRRGRRPPAAGARGRLRLGPGAARGGLGSASAAAAAARCSAISRSFSARSAASFSARSRASSASRASVASRSFWRRSASCALRRLDGLQAPLELGVREVRRGAGPDRPGWAPAGAPGFGHHDALALVLDRHRLGPAVAEALAHVAGLGAAPAQPERLALAVAVLGIHHSVSSLSRGGLPPPIRPSAASADAVPIIHVPDA